MQSPRVGYAILAVATVAIALGTARVFAVVSRPPGPRGTAASFVAAVNRGDWRAACAAYSTSYLRISQRACRSFWWWGWRLYGEYRYRIVRARSHGERFHVELSCRGHRDFVEFALEGGAWRVVAGGW
jgi:hypothetical protein